MQRGVLVFIVLASAVASAAPTDDVAEATRAFREARRECPQPARRIKAMVQQVFDATAFSRSVVRDWSSLTDAQRADLAERIDGVVGAERRLLVARHVCGRMRDDTYPTDGTTTFRVQSRVDQDDRCIAVTLALHGSDWRVTHAARCHVPETWHESWRKRLGGYYATAIAYLRARDTHKRR